MGCGLFKKSKKAKRGGAGGQRYQAARPVNRPPQTGSGVSSYAPSGKYSQGSSSNSSSSAIGGYGGYGAASQAPTQQHADPDYEHNLAANQRRADQAAAFAAKAAERKFGAQRGQQIGRAVHTGAGYAAREYTEHQFRKQQMQQQQPQPGQEQY